LIFKLTSDKSKQESFNNYNSTNIYKFNRDSEVNSTLLVPIINLQIRENPKEKDWINSLSEYLNGESEVKVEYGRVDVLTNLYAIEIDSINNWKEGLGQALHYSNATNKIGVLAIYDKKTNFEYSNDNNLIYTIEKLCLKNGVKLIMLKNKN